MALTGRIWALALVLLSARAWAAEPDPACPPVARPFSPEMFTEAAAQARDRGLLWRLTKDMRSSYLYGTLHVGKAEWMAPGPLLRQALQQTTVVGLELDPLDPQMQREMAQGMAQRPPVAMPVAMLARLEKLWAAECMPPQAPNHGLPGMQVFTLIFMAGRRDGLEPVFGTEVMLSMTGRRMGKKVVSLESPAAQLEALLGPDDSEMQELLGSALDDLESALARQLMQRTARAWEDADLGELERYDQWCECLKTPSERKLMKRLLDDRNPVLAQRIDEIHAAGSTLFAAVGAMHMAGPNGIPALLERRGYKVTRLR